MILIACSILSTTSAKAEKTIGICSSTIFHQEYPQDTILRGIIIAEKFG